MEDKNKKNKKIVHSGTYNGHQVEIEFDQTSNSTTPYKVIVDGTGTGEASNSISAGINIAKTDIDNNKKKFKKKQRRF